MAVAELCVSCSRRLRVVSVGLRPTAQRVVLLGDVLGEVGGDHLV